MCYMTYQFLVFLDCKIPAGMEDRRIADKQITASTYRLGHFSYEGRLHNKAENRGNKTKWGAWCADETDLHPYLQVGTNQYCDFTQATFFITCMPDMEKVGFRDLGNILHVCIGNKG